MSKPKTKGRAVWRCVEIARIMGFTPETIAGQFVSEGLHGKKVGRQWIAT